MGLKRISTVRTESERFKDNGQLPFDANIVHAVDPGRQGCSQHDDRDAILFSIVSRGKKYYSAPVGEVALARVFEDSLKTEFVGAERVNFRFSFRNLLVIWQAVGYLNAQRLGPILKNREVRLTRAVTCV